MPSVVSTEHGCCTRLAKILELLEDYFFIFTVFWLKIDKIFGDWFDSNEGTSAGTRLGPLFIMYIHDVPKCIAPKFADDLVSVAVENDVESVKEQL